MANPKILPDPPLQKEGITPLFFKEGVGEIFTGASSINQHFLQIESVGQALTVTLAKPVDYLS